MNKQHLEEPRIPRLTNLLDKAPKIRLMSIPFGYDIRILGNTISIMSLFPPKSYGERHLSRADILLKIKTAEQDAQQILFEAQEKQKNIVSSARKEAVDMVQKAEAKLREEHNSALSSERDRVAGLRNELLKKGKEEATAIDKRSDELVKKAKIHLKSLFERTIDATS
jgi:V/A-type H+-transporting ATPase subunit G/H